MKYKLLRTWCFYIPWSYFLKLNHEQNFKDIKYFFKRLKNKILTHIERERERAKIAIASILMGDMKSMV